MQLNAVSSQTIFRQMTYSPARISLSPPSGIRTFVSDQYLQTSPLPGPDTSNPPLFDQGPIRLALMTAGSAAVGGTAGYYVSQAAGWSVKGGAIGGALLGAVIPLALVAWAIHKLN